LNGLFIKNYLFELYVMNKFIDKCFLLLRGFWDYATPLLFRVGAPDPTWSDPDPMRRGPDSDLALRLQILTYMYSISIILSLDKY
jgi:hypothetical protein